MQNPVPWYRALFYGDKTCASWASERALEWGLGNLKRVVFQGGFEAES